MLYLILAGIVGLIAVLFLLLSFHAPKEPQGEEVARSSFRVAFGLCVFILLALTAAFAATTVSPRAVGIQTAFGKYKSTLPAGFHWTAPWAGVEEFPTQVQFLELNGATEKGKGGVDVNYKGGGKGTVDATVRWRIDEKNAEDLWRKYRDFDKVRDQLVISSARDSIRVAVGAYAPNEARAGENLRVITSAVQADLSKTLADDGIRIDSISTTGVFLDDNTQKSIEKVIAAQNDVERAKADQARARIDAETAKIREQSGSLSAGALQRYCLEVTNSWDDDKNGQLPATWSCLGGQTAPVIVGQR